MFERDPSAAHLLYHFAPRRAAKKLADHKLGRFIFIFSPSDKLNALSGKLSRATVVSVGDLTELEALDFLGQIGCDASHAAAVHGLVDGHLPFLVLKPVHDFCHGLIDLRALTAHFTSLVRSVFKRVDNELKCDGGSGCACQAACAVRDEKWSHVSLEHAVPVLLQEHIVRASLKEKIHVIDSRFVLCYVARECACNGTDYVVSPPCG